jgi:hypothetical protein
VLRLIELANIHPSSSAAGNLKYVSVRGAHFKYAILVAESFYRTFDLYDAIGCIDHRSLSRKGTRSTENLGGGRGKLN